LLKVLYLYIIYKVYYYYYSISRLERLLLSYSAAKARFLDNPLYSLRYILYNLSLILKESAILDKIFYKIYLRFLEKDYTELFKESSLIKRVEILNTSSKKYLIPRK